MSLTRTPTKTPRPHHYIERYVCGCVSEQCRCPGPKTEITLACVCPKHAPEWKKRYGIK